MKRPSENPQDAAERKRQLRLAEIERTQATQDQASGLTSDLRGLYGTATAPSMAGTPMKPVKGGGKNKPSIWNAGAAK